MQKRIAMMLALAVPVLSSAMEQEGEGREHYVEGQVALLSNAALHTLPNIYDFSSQQQASINGVVSDLRAGNPVNKKKLKDLNDQMAKAVRDESKNRWHVAYADNEQHFNNILAHIRVPIYKDNVLQGHSTLFRVAQDALNDDKNEGRWIYAPKVGSIINSLFWGSAIGAGLGGAVRYITSKSDIKYVIAAAVGGAVFSTWTAAANAKLQYNKRKAKSDHMHQEFIQPQSEESYHPLSVIPVYRTDQTLVTKRDSSSSSESKKKESEKDGGAIRLYYNEIYEKDAIICKRREMRLSVGESEPVLVASDGFVISDFQIEPSGSENVSAKYAVRRFKMLENTEKYKYEEFRLKKGCIPALLSNQKIVHEALSEGEDESIYIIQTDLTKEATPNKMHTVAERFAERDKHNSVFNFSLSSNKFHS